VVTGTPLSGWPLITDSQRRELEYFNIVTVEQLADVNDSFAGTMMGVHQLKQAAQRYIAAAKEKAPAIHLTKELESRDAQIAQLQDQLSKLASLVEAQQKQALADTKVQPTLTLKGNK
jgi:predicted RecB family nuclease